jgi:hypothetical protein
MLGLAIELRVRCEGCGQPVAVNAFTERVTCRSCQRGMTLDTERWMTVLETPLAEFGELDPDEGRNVTMMGGAGMCELMFGNQAPRCNGCKAAVVAEALGFADRGWTVCIACGQRMSVRRAPPALAAVGAVALVNEDLDQLSTQPTGAVAAAPGGIQPILFHCPGCTAPLSVDGSKRMITCQYCAVEVYLPDDLWQRLHPAPTTSRWYLWMTEVDRAAARLAKFHWYSFADAVIDAQGNLYCAGEDKDRDCFAVWCMTRDLKVRWVRDGLDYDDSDARLALDPQGRLLLWQKGKHSATVLAVADGSVVGKLGGREPEGATEHHLDLDRGDQLLVDVDSTIVGLIGERLVRFGPDGSARATWPPRSGIFGKKGEKLHPLYGSGHQLADVDGVYVEQVGNHPATFDDYTKLCFGSDGRLYAERSEWVACFDREGNRVYRIKLPLDNRRGDRIAVDQAGQLYLLGTTPGDPRPRQLVRVSPDGKRVDVISGDRRVGGAIGDEDHMVVAPDGTVLVFGYNSRCRIIGSDGRLVFQTDKSRETDREEDEAAAKRA